MTQTSSSGSLGEGATRAAETLLRSLGGQSVLLRMPVAAVPNDDAEQLGLASPQFQDVRLGPACFRKLGNESAMLLAAEAVLQATETFAFHSADVLFANAAALVIDDSQYAVTHCAAMQAGSLPFAYRLTLRKLT